MHTHQPLSGSSGLLTLTREKQPGARLPHCRFHALIGRIFPAALECNFDAGRIISQRGSARRNHALLAQSSCLHVKVKNQLVCLPLKWLDRSRSRSNTRNGRYESSGCRDAAGRQKFPAIHRHDVRLSPVSSFKVTVTLSRMDCIHCGVEVVNSYGYDTLRHAVILSSLRDLTRMPQLLETPVVSE